jgi:tRNA(Glu) U13 pseudouridine synthase TruD
MSAGEKEESQQIEECDAIVLDLDNFKAGPNKTTQFFTYAKPSEVFNAIFQTLDQHDVNYLVSDKKFKITYKKTKEAQKFDEETKEEGLEDFIQPAPESTSV